MNWNDPAEVCSTLNLDTQEGLGEAILIAILNCKDKDGKLLRIMLGDGSHEEHIRHGMHIANILVNAKKLRSVL